MYENYFKLKERVNSQISELHEIKEDFKRNLKPKLQQSVGYPLSQTLLNELQREINYFLERNNLKILVSVIGDDQTTNSISLFGQTLIDNIVWEAITKEINEES